MNRFDCLLTVVIPHRLEDEFVDLLLRYPEWVVGFTIAKAEGKGRQVTLHGAGEEVRGRARRVQLQMVMAREDAAALLDELKRALPSAQIAYWLVPVIEFGRFA